MDGLLFLGLGRVEGGVGPGGVARHATRTSELFVIIRLIPIPAPFPNVACHVVETVTVGRELADRRQPGETVRRAVLHWETALIDIGHPTAACFQFVAP